MTRRITVRSGAVPRKVVPPASIVTAAGTDTDAIHDNVADEISSITTKASPTNADFLLIEDAAASNVKKQIIIGNLPGGGGEGGGGWKDAVISSEGPGGVDDDEFNDGSIDGWTSLLVSGSATWTEKHDILSVVFEDLTTGDTASQLKAISGTPTAPIEITTAVRGMSNSNHCAVGIVFTDGLTAAAKSLYVRFNFSDASVAINSGTLGNIQTVILSQASLQQEPSSLVYLKNVWVSANTWHAYASPDGVSWIDFGFGTDSFAMTPTHYGLAVTSFVTGTAKIGSFEYFRSDV